MKMILKTILQNLMTLMQKRLKEVIKKKLNMISKLTILENQLKLNHLLKSQISWLIQIWTMKIKALPPKKIQKLQSLFFLRNQNN